MYHCIMISGREDPLLIIKGNFTFEKHYKIWINFSETAGVIQKKKIPTAITLLIGVYIHTKAVGSFP